MRNQIDFPEICKKLRPFLGDKIDQLYLQYSLAEDNERRQEIYQIIIALYSRYIDSRMLDNNVLLEPPRAGILDAKYPLGIIKYPNQSPQTFGLRDKDWQRHVCISGMTGSGKTTFAIKILDNFIKHDKSFLVFDWKKSFRKLLHLSDEVICFTVGKPKVTNLFRFNINRPPKGVSPDEWITILSDLLCECYGASFGVHRLLTDVMRKAYEEFGVYAGSENYPTWFQIKDRLEAMEGEGGKRQSEWLTSALRIAHSLTFGEFGNVINDKSKFNLSIEEMLTKKVIFELDALGNMEKKFFCSYILLYIYKFKKADPKKTDAAILVDEAHNIFLKERPSFSYESVTDIIYREIREYGVSLICLDQHVSKLSDTVLGNSSTNIAFQQILPQDVDCISRLMFLYDQRDIYTRLKVGQAIVKLTERHNEPFVIDVEPVDVSDEPIDDHKMRELVKEHVLYEKRLKLAKTDMDERELAAKINKTKCIAKVSLCEISDRAAAKHAQAAIDQEKTKNVYLKNHLQKHIYGNILQQLENYDTIKQVKEHYVKQGFDRADINQAFKYFRDTADGRLITEFLDMFNSISHSKTHNPVDFLNFMQKLRIVDENLPTSQLYNELGISIRKGNDIRKTLLEMGLIDIYEERNNKGMTKKIRFTPLGLDFMEKLGIAS